MCRNEKEERKTTYGILTCAFHLPFDWSPRIWKCLGCSQATVTTDVNPTDPARIRVVTADLYVRGKWHVSEQLLQEGGGQKSLLPPNENAV